MNRYPQSLEVNDSTANQRANTFLYANNSQQLNNAQSNSRCLLGGPTAASCNSSWKKTQKRRAVKYVFRIFHFHHYYKTVSEALLNLYKCLVSNGQTRLTITACTRHAFGGR